MIETKNIAQLRREFSGRPLREEDVLPDPFTQFKQWLQEAINAQLPEPTAMTLATATKRGKPSARVVLLKHVDERGFVFYTNYLSRKAEDLRENPSASLLFYWEELHRQIRIEGTVERTSREETEEYFRTRRYESRISAWASKQSAVIPSREELERKFIEFRQRFPTDDVPAPEFWGGFRLIPESFEFWQGRESRLHDRILYTKKGKEWVIARLSP
ncbi:MAG TPA: pyridoxamine 5'-phosphate oxidase [Bacteroidota bacterium]|nr:pyridoxamine 5'-phosphate oxidase [Bacteroidota bacterium]